MLNKQVPPKYYFTRIFNIQTHAILFSQLSLNQTLLFWKQILNSWNCEWGQRLKASTTPERGRDARKKKSKKKEIPCYWHLSFPDLLIFKPHDCEVSNSLANWMVSINVDLSNSSKFLQWNSKHENRCCDTLNLH